MSASTANSSPPFLDLTRPGIIEASAGTGKTYTIAEIYLALLCGKKRYPATADSGTPFETPPSVREILVVTFTEAATAELSDRLKKRIRQALQTGTLDAKKTDQSPPLSPREHTLLRLADAEFDEAAISTIHGFCTRMLRDFSFDCGLPPALAPAENISDEIGRFAKRFRTQQRLLGNEKISALPADKITKILKALAKNPDIAIARPANADDLNYFIATKGLKAWKEERSRRETLSFDEVLLRLRDALRNNDALAEKIAKRYKIALVDEFQDTDPVQWEIFDRIFVQKNRPFFCVGDPKQAIYEFRGGDIRTYRQAQKVIARNGNRLTLDKNWRSTPEMIDAVNKLFENDSKISKKQEADPSSDESDTDTPDFKRGNHLAYVSVSPGKAAVAAPHAAIFFREGFEGNGETARAAIIQKLADDIFSLVNDQRIPPSACAVLVKKNTDAPAVLNALTRRGIPAVMTATASVLAETEAEDLEKILCALLAPRDSKAVRHATVTHFFDQSFFRSLLPSNEDETLARLQETFFEAAKIWERKGILPAFAYLEKHYKFTQTLSAQSNPARRLTNLRHLLEILQTAAHKNRLPPQALVKKFQELREHPDPDSEEQRLRIDSDAPAVQIITVHKSKGLEYDIVFLPSLWDLPFEAARNHPDLVRRENGGKTEIIFNDKSKEFQKAEIEAAAQTNACVTYVAFTRAKQACIVYHANATASGKNVDSYAKRLFDAAGVFSASETKEHRIALKENDALPPVPFTQSEKPKEDFSRKILENPTTPSSFAEAPWGIFSFSKIIGNASETLPESLEIDAPESARSRDAENASKIYSAPEQYDLPAGAQFGTLVHSIFEELDFSTQKNLDALIAQKRARFPEWLDDEDSRKKFRTLFASTLEIPFDGPLTLAQINSERDTLRELEFFFRMKPSENLYAQLHDVFLSWGGIYKRTAEALWNPETYDTRKIDGLMHGYIDLVARANGRYYVIDWKTNRVMEKGEKTMSRQNLEDEIVESGYALQWAIYMLALRRFLQKTIGENYSTPRNLGGIAYFFVRWNAVFFDNSLDDTKLDRLETVLMESEI